MKVTRPITIIEFDQTESAALHKIVCIAEQVLNDEIRLGPVPVSATIMRACIERFELSGLSQFARAIMDEVK